MHEFVITRLNPHIDPHLAIWGWEIPVYLFLGGLVAGLLLISGYYVFSGRFREYEGSSWRQVPIISLVLLTFGMIALFLDLEHKVYVWRLYTSFEASSPMSWGAWLLLLVYPAIVGTLLLRVPESWSKRTQKHFRLLHHITSAWRDNVTLVKTIGMINMLLGCLLGMYTGVLLSALGARPLWNSAILWLLFLVSGISSASALTHMIAHDKRERELFAKVDNSFLVIELLIMALFIIGLTSSHAVGLQAAQLLLTGPYAPVFWVLVVGIGIVLPLVVQTLAVQHKVKHTPVIPLLVLAGGLILRFVIVYAGQSSHWQSGINAALR